LREPNARARRRLQQIAFHQAGHAVIAHALGVAFDGVSVFPDEFERGAHLPLSSPNIGPDEHIKILQAGVVSCSQFAPSPGGNARDKRRDDAQIERLATGLAPSPDEPEAYFKALNAWEAKLFARPANQAAVGALATALLAHGRLDGQRAREVIEQARKAARRRRADGAPAPSDSAADILPELVAAVPAPTRRSGAYTNAQLAQPDRGALWDELLQRAERADVPAAWARGTHPKRRYLKHCLDKSWGYVLDHAGLPDLADGMRLVLGLVSFPSKRWIPFRHAWVELPNEVVFDGVVQTFFTRQSYYAVMGAEAQQWFTRAETLAGIRKSSDFGFNDVQYTSCEAIAAYLRRFGRSSGICSTDLSREPAPPD
jgi:hypothetical protein